MTRFGSTVVPNNRPATLATSRRWSSQDPSVDMVAEVPMHWRVVEARQASRTRRIRNATSAPWRPR